MRDHLYPSHLIDVTGSLVRAVRAVHLVVTEESLGNALAIAALELVLRTHRLVGVQVRKHLAGLLERKLDIKQLGNVFSRKLT